MMEVAEKTTLHIQSVSSMNTNVLDNDFLLRQAIDMAKAAYGDNIFMVLISTTDEGEELAIRPDMAQFMSNPEKQYMRISTLTALKDIFVCHNTITVDGLTRTQREPTQRSFYTISDGRILAINPEKESLEKFWYSWNM